MLFVLCIVSLLLFIQVSNVSIISNNSISHEQQKINNLIMQFNYIKSKAIKENQSITLLFNDYSNKVIVREQFTTSKTIHTIKLPHNCFIHPRTNLHFITFNKSGERNKFGSLYIKTVDSLYKIIFHIDKGRIRYEQI
ncbi:competence protein [Staphylococcus edaphicus]|uniref:Competence protein n=1 Tax=Staphylococcus edaphicus TaxID=1955013 RepID=A0A2C6U7M5_9STAP|nr:competence protein [Staphylococcus edaphicus]PHK49802.1 competence protein [Staphylococcus edaphicus]